MSKIEQMQTPENIKDLAEVNMTNWLELVSSGDPEKVANVYSEDSFFHPTVSGDFKKGVSGAKDYFVHFLAKNPKGKILDEEVTSIDDNSYTHKGVYSFELDGEDGRTSVEAEFTYLWRKEGDDWKIVYHHSSLVSDEEEIALLAKNVGIGIQEVEGVELNDEYRFEAGMYNFDANQGESSKNIQARFSRLLKNDENGKSIIIHQHLSRRPGTN